MKTKVIFDEQMFNNELAEYESEVAEIKSEIARLVENGIDNNIEGMRKCIRLSDQEFIDLVKGMFSDYLKRVGHVVKRERERIAESFDGMIEDCLPILRGLRRKIEKYDVQLILADGEIVPDSVAVEGNLRKKHTHHYNIEKVQEYFSEILKANKALIELRAWEQKNGMAESFTRDVFFYLGDADQAARRNGIPCPPREVKSFDFLKNPNEEKFFEMTSRYFEVKD